MTIQVSHHAIERYAERIIGFPEGEKPTARERKVIEAAIRLAVERCVPSSALSFRVRAPDATYVVVQRRVVTVLHPSMEHERLMQRRKKFNLVRAHA